MMTSSRVGSVTSSFLTKYTLNNRVTDLHDGRHNPFRIPRIQRTVCL